MIPENHAENDYIEMRIGAHPEYLCLARLLVRKLGEMVGLREKDVDSVALAVDEAMANVIRHDYGGPCGDPILLRLGKRRGSGDADDALEIIVRDFGRQVDPATIKSRDLDEVRPGGMGVHIIQSIMEKVEYSCPIDGGMQLRMAKYIRSETPNDAACKP